MNKRRVIWGIILAALAANLVLSESIASTYLFIGALLLPVLSILVTVLGVKSVDIEISLPKTCGKKQAVQGILRIGSIGLLPVFKGEIQVNIHNVMTMEEKKETIVTGFSRQPESLNFTLENDHCGMVEVSVETVTIVDPFGLWQKVIHPQEKAELTVLPDTFPLHLQLVRSNLDSSDSIEYAQGRTGNDVSEIFGIREYQEGDSIRNIHWKLSSKCDDVMVKLPSLLLENSLLLLLETGISGEEEIQPAAFDALAEIYMTISQTLIDNEIAHKAAWYDQRTQRLFIFALNDEDDLHGIMGKVLAVERGVDRINAVQRVLEEFGHLEQAHLVYVSHKDGGAMEQVPDELIKTAVVCSEKGARASGIYDYTCTPEDYPVQLRSMII